MREPLYPLLKLVRLRMGTDGDGVSTLVAGAGCPLHCPLCINARLLREAEAEYVTAAELARRLSIDDLYFRATGGGVCFGGGEPLLHASFLPAFRQAAPSEWKIRVETSLAVPTDLVRQAAEAVDDYIVDCKDMDPGIYHRYTGGDKSLMEKNLRLLLDIAGPEHITVRVPLIPGFNTESDQARSAEALLRIGLKKLDLFRYV